MTRNLTHAPAYSGTYSLPTYRLDITTPKYTTADIIVCKAVSWNDWNRRKAVRQLLAVSWAKTDYWSLIDLVFSGYRTSGGVISSGMSYLDPDENGPASKGYKQWRAIRLFSVIALLIAVAMSLLISWIKT